MIGPVSERDNHWKRALARTRRHPSACLQTLFEASRGHVTAVCTVRCSEITRRKAALDK